MLGLVRTGDFRNGNPVPATDPMYDSNPIPATIAADSSRTGTPIDTTTHVYGNVITNSATKQFGNIITP